MLEGHTLQANTHIKIKGSSIDPTNRQVHVSWVKSNSIGLHSIVFLALCVFLSGVALFQFFGSLRDFDVDSALQRRQNGVWRDTSEMASQPVSVGDDNVMAVSSASSNIGKKSRMVTPKMRWER